MRSTIFICILFFHTFTARTVISLSEKRPAKIRRRNMVVNMKPIIEDEPIFGRVDVSKEVQENEESTTINPNSLNELVHKIGEFLFDKNKKTKRRRTRSNGQKEPKSLNSEKSTLMDMENRIINPINTEEENWERHRRIKRN